MYQTTSKPFPSGIKWPPFILLTDPVNQNFGQGGGMACLYSIKVSNECRYFGMGGTLGRIISLELCLPMRVDKRLRLNPWVGKKEMVTCSNIFTWRIPWTEEPGGMQSMGSHRVRHDWSDLARTWPLGFPVSSAGKESSCNAGDPDSIPGSGSFPGKGIGYPLQYSWASLVAQMGKNTLWCGRPGFDPWVVKIPYRRARQPSPVLLPGGSPGHRNLAGYSPEYRKKSDMTQ